MLSGHLREKNNTYYAVLNCKHSDGKRYSKWVSTGIAVKKGNKRAAEKKLEEFCTTYDEYGNLPGEKPEAQQNAQLATVGKISSDILFCDYMLTWLSYVETEVDPVTYSGYCNCVENNVYPYFKETGIKLSELEPAHLREFYRYERKGDPEHGRKQKKGTTVAHYHAAIHAALELALEDKVILSTQHISSVQKPSVSLAASICRTRHWSVSMQPKELVWSWLSCLDSFMACGEVKSLA